MRLIRSKSFMQYKELKSKNIGRINLKMNYLINLMKTRVMRKPRIRMKIMMSLMSTLTKKKWEIRNKRKLIMIRNKEGNGVI